jgi:hypothetical protein
MSILDSGTGNDSGDNFSAEGKSSEDLNNEFQDASANESSQAGLQENVERSEESKADAAAWYYDENTPGEGERPEWLKEKYKSAADQAKAYNEIEKKLGKFQGAPEEYDLALPDNPEFSFEQGDPVLDEFLTFAKESNASQEFVTKALQQYIKAQEFYAPDPQVEIEKLGINAKTEVSQLTEWANQRLTKDEFETFKGLVTTADAFRVIQKLRRVTTSQNETAVTNNIKSEPQVSERQVMEMIGDPRFNSDPLYRKEVEQKASKLWG